jgi:hypothetical protein
LALCQSISLGIPILRQSILFQAHQKETLLSIPHSNNHLLAHE